MTLRPGTRADVRAAAAVFGRSFHTTPQWEWLIPDERARAGVLPAFFRSSFGHVRRHGRLMVAVDDADTVVGGHRLVRPRAVEDPGVAGCPGGPGAQTGGVGTALIREGLDVADSEGQPVYLECVEELIPYYERFGFAVTGRIEPGQVGMWRQVRSGRTS